jgi:prepilin-type N-terminal cleavage/methylation domain-containing protein
MEETGRPGFTLLELLVTLAIAGVLAGTAVPALTGFIDRNRLQGAAELLIQELRQARHRALTFQRTSYFSVSATAGDDWCYGWSDRPACDCRLGADQAGACTSGDGAAPVLHRRQSADFPRVSLALRGVAPGLPLQFNAVRGTANAGTLSVSNRSGEIQVIVSPLGRVRGCATRGTVLPPC